MMILRKCKSLIFQTFQYPLNLQKTHHPVRLFALFSSSSSKENISDHTKVVSSLSILKDAQKCDSILTFFKDVGFSTAQLDNILLKKPALLGSDLDQNIKPKIQIFQDLGFSISDIAAIFAGDSRIYSPSLMNKIVPSVATLKSVLGSIPEVARVLKLSVCFFECDLQKTMLPNIDYLKSCGTGTDQIVIFIHSFPRFLLHKPQNFKRFVKKAENLGCERNSRMFIYAVRTISSMSEETWKQKLELFRELGFSKKQILALFQKHPQVFAVSCQKIRKGVKLVLDSKNYDISDVLRFPLMFTCSLEKTIEPRLRVLDILIRRKLLKKTPALYVTYHIPKEVFFDTYIVPYLGEVDEFRNLDDWSTEFSKLDGFCS